jgi:DnaJ-class molecular chaperone
MSDYCHKCKSRLSTCPTCKGKGMLSKSTVFTTSSERCPNCAGTGQLCPRHGNDHG